MLDNPYRELGVAASASDDEIRKAYRRLAKELHPDARPGDDVAEERFKRVTAAFALLSDSGRRRRYDRGEIDGDGNEIHRGFAGGRRARSNGGGRHGPGGPDFADVFSSVFGQDEARNPFNAKGADARYKLTVSFEEAVNGGRKRVTMGDGKALDLTIPEGVKAGQVLRLRGQGGPSVRGGPAGDALVELEVETHPHFERDGDDIRLELPITLTEAVLGAKVRVPTLTGPVTVTIPKGANSGQVLRLRGKGVRSDKGRGDQLIKLKVVLPERADAELQRFVSRWRPPQSYDPRKDVGL